MTTLTTIETTTSAHEGDDMAIATLDTALETMTVQFEVKTLKTALTALKKTLGKGGASQGGLLITVSRECATLTTSNGDASLEMDIPASEARDGACVVEYKTLASFVTTARGFVSVRRDGDRITLESASSRQSTRQLYDTDLFPSMAVGETWTRAATIDATAYLPVATIAASFARKEDYFNPSTPMLGVYHEFDASHFLTVTASDGFTLYHRGVYEGVQTANFVTALNIPASAVKVATQLWKKGEITISVLNGYLSTGRNIMRYQSGGTRLMSRFNTGRYVNYRQLFPSKYKSTMHEIDSAQLLAYAKQAQATDDEIIRLDFDRSGITVSMRDAGGNEVRASLDGYFASGEYGYASFDSRLLAKCLAGAPAMVTLRTNGYMSVANINEALIMPKYRASDK